MRYARRRKPCMPAVRAVFAGKAVSFTDGRPIVIFLHLAHDGEHGSVHVDFSSSSMLDKPTLKTIGPGILEMASSVAD